MLVLRDQERKFPLQEIAFNGATLDDIFAALLSLKRANIPQWTDESPSDFGIQLLWLFATLSKWLNADMERSMANTYVGTANDRQAMRSLLQLIGYSLAEAAPASAVITFTCEAGHTGFTIAKGTRVGTVESSDVPAIVLEVQADTIVSAGLTTIDVQVTEGEAVTNEIVGSSDGVSAQKHTLKLSPVIWQSESIEVRNGSIWEPWARVSDFVLNIGSDKVYRIEVDTDSVYSIHFGDAINGAIPSRGANNIRVTYRKGGGVSGNVSAGTITELLDKITEVTAVTNKVGSSGGVDRETLDHARLFGPASIKTLDRAVTASDIETLAESFTSATSGGVARAKAFSLGGYAISVMIVPKSGGLPSATLKSELQTVLDASRMMGSSLRVRDPLYLKVDITAEIFSLRNHAASQVATSVFKRLVAHLSPSHQDPSTGVYPNSFGRNIYLSDLYSLIDGTEGVDFCRITVPTGDTFAPEFQIPEVGTLTLNINNPSSQEFSFTQVGIDTLPQNLKNAGASS